jgi:hypothetical protein
LTLALDTQKRPGTVGLPAEGHGRGWLRGKIRAPRALTAVVSPRRSVDQPLHGPQVLLYYYLYMFLCVNLCIYVCMHVCMYVCIYVYILIRVCVVYIYICICMYICVYMYIT